MCMIDGADGCNTFSSDHFPKARKLHKCEECGRAIHIGERYHYHAWLYDGDFGTSKMCAHCEVAGQWLQDNCGGYLVGSVWEDVEEHVSEFRYQKPACLARLMRLQIGRRRKWLIKRGPNAGRLMSVPQKPSPLEPLKKAA